MAGGQDPRVRLVGATKTYRRGVETIVAVDDATMELAPGSLIVVAGPSGSGKTTLLNLLLGWETPDAGRREPPIGRATWDRLAVVPQRLGLVEHCTIGENVAMPGRAVPLAVDAAALMRRLGIDHLADRFPAETSLGEQQRTAVARALVTAPQVLIADEPTSHQDEVNTRRIGALLREAASGGSSVVVATHDPRVAELADVRLTIADGRLAAG